MIGSTALHHYLTPRLPPPIIHLVAAWRSNLSMSVFQNDLGLVESSDSETTLLFDSSKDLRFKIIILPSKGDWEFACPIVGLKWLIGPRSRPKLRLEWRVK